MDFKGLNLMLRKAEQESCRKDSRVKGWDIESGYHELWSRVYHDSSSNEQSDSIHAA